MFCENDEDNELTEVENKTDVIIETRTGNRR